MNYETHQARLHEAILDGNGDSVLATLRARIDQMSTLGGEIIRLDKFPAISGVEKAGSGSTALVVFNVPSEESPIGKGNRLKRKIQHSFIAPELRTTEVRVPIMQCLMYLSDLTDRDGHSNVPEIILEGKRDGGTAAQIRIDTRNIDPQIIVDICMKLLEADIQSSRTDNDLVFHSLVKYLEAKGTGDFEEALDTAIQGDIRSGAIRLKRFLYRWGVLSRPPDYEALAQKRIQKTGKPKALDLVRSQEKIFTSEGESASRFVNLLIFSSLGVKPEVVLEGKGVVEIPVESVTKYGLERTKKMTLRIASPEDRIFVVDRTEELDDIDTLCLRNATVGIVTIEGVEGLKRPDVSSREYLTIMELHNALNQVGEQTHFSQSRVARTATLHGGTYDHIVIRLPLQFDTKGARYKHPLTIDIHNFQAAGDIVLTELLGVAVKMARVRGQLLLRGISGHIEVQSGDGNVIAELSPELCLVIKQRVMEQCVASGIGNLQIDGCTIGITAINDCKGYMSKSTLVGDTHEVTFSPEFTLDLSDEDAQKVRVTK